MGDRPPEACIAADHLSVRYPGVSGGFVRETSQWHAWIWEQVSVGFRLESF